jgi:hypothetical protein
MLACSYFSPFEKSGITFADGAVFANNPAEIGEFVGRLVFKSEQRFKKNLLHTAIAEANIIWNFPDIDLVVSIGTGLTTAGNNAYDDDSSDDDADDNLVTPRTKKSKKAAKAKAKARAAKAKSAAKVREPKGDCRFTFGQDVIDLADTGLSVHNNMRQVLNENEKYVRLEPELSKPWANSTVPTVSVCLSVFMFAVTCFDERKLVLFFSHSVGC